MPKFKIEEKKLNKTLFLLEKYFKYVFVPLLGLKILYKMIFDKYSFSSWQISEFLINYEGGFVRRGLIGQFFFILKDLINVKFLIYSLSALSIIYLYNYLFKKIYYNSRYPFFILGSSFVTFPFIVDSFVRKDLFLLSLVIIILKNKNVFFRAIIYSLGILSHEMFFFMISPFLIHQLIIKKEVEWK